MGTVLLQCSSAGSFQLQLIDTVACNQVNMVYSVLTGYRSHYYWDNLGSGGNGPQVYSGTIYGSRVDD